MKIAELRERRCARFFISRAMVEDCPEQVRAIMGQCVVLKAEFDYAQDRFDYTAESPLFPVCPRGTVPMVVIWELGQNGLKVT